MKLSEEELNNFKENLRKLGLNSNIKPELSYKESEYSAGEASNYHGKPAACTLTLAGDNPGVQGGIALTPAATANALLIAGKLIGAGQMKHGKSFKEAPFIVNGVENTLATDRSGTTHTNPVTVAFGSVEDMRLCVSAVAEMARVEPQTSAGYASKVGPGSRSAGWSESI